MSLRESETMAGFQPAEPRIRRGHIGSFNRRGRPARSRIVLAIVVFAGFATFIYSGIRSRVEAEKRLEENVRSSATRLVEVIHPQADSSAQEIELPGTTEAFTEAPIYARTSGYLKQWYLDIGAHAKQDNFWPRSKRPNLISNCSKQRASLGQRKLISNWHK